MAGGLKIGELALRTDCPVQTIRYYEREGLLPEPERTEGNYRLYGKAHLERLSIIRRCRSLDMPLGEIRALLSFRDAPEENCARVNTLLDSHINHVAARIAELKVLEKELKQLRQQCGESNVANGCGILNNLAAELAAPKRPKKLKTGHLQCSHTRETHNRRT